jgi:hypothetical protein
MLPLSQWGEAVTKLLLGVKPEGKEVSGSFYPLPTTVPFEDSLYDLGCSPPHTKGYDLSTR